jgi:hypothetical protein
VILHWRSLEISGGQRGDQTTIGAPIYPPGLCALRVTSPAAHLALPHAERLAHAGTLSTCRTRVSGQARCGRRIGHRAAALVLLVVLIRA